MGAIRSFSGSRSICYAERLAQAGIEPSIRLLPCGLPTSPARQLESPAAQLLPTPHARRDTNKRSCSRARRGAGPSCVRQSAPSSSRPQRLPLRDHLSSTAASSCATGPASRRRYCRRAPRSASRSHREWTLPMRYSSGSTTSGFCSSSSCCSSVVRIVLAPGTVVGVNPA